MGKSHYMSYLIVVSKFIEIALLHECSWRFAAWFDKHLLCAGREVANHRCEFQVKETTTRHIFTSRLLKKTLHGRSKLKTFASLTFIYYWFPQVSKKVLKT